ncbi:nitrate reductase [nadh] 1 [Quercus suber]|uniref:Nitrate reductase [nadh] 1 n=1 Tax=Quercus suber TaxID=58331 RepID=A0AAW0KKR6_QUESU
MRPRQTIGCSATLPWSASLENTPSTSSRHLLGSCTPAPLHYVRNHGKWETWTVALTGLVNKPTMFTMDQLVTEFPNREIPVTLVCAGNR